MFFAGEERICGISEAAIEQLFRNRWEGRVIRLRFYLVEYYESAGRLSRFEVGCKHVSCSCSLVQGISQVRWVEQNHFEDYSRRHGVDEKRNKVLRKSAGKIIELILFFKPTWYLFHFIFGFVLLVLCTTILPTGAFLQSRFIKYINLKFAMSDIRSDVSADKKKTHRWVVKGYTKQLHTW